MPSENQGFEEAPDKQVLRINAELNIPLSEVRFRYARSSGPGGQNVNRTATKVELLWDMLGSPSLSAEHKLLLRQRLKGCIDQQGLLHLVSQGTRSQLRNREEVLARLCALLAASLRVNPQRVPSKPSRAARENRMQSKRARGQVKAHRHRVETVDE